MTKLTFPVRVMLPAKRNMQLSRPAFLVIASKSTMTRKALTITQKLHDALSIIELLANPSKLTSPLPKIRKPQNHMLPPKQRQHNS
jgi:hypothetical protein